MRMRTVFAITLTMFALPALAVGQRDEAKSTDKPVGAEALARIADVQLDAALDEKTAASSRDALLDRARKGYERALQADPKCQSALIGMARYHARTEQKDRAVEQYKKYLTLYPKDAEVAHEVAVAHAKWKDWTGATAWCEFALKIDPENRTVKKTLGFCLAGVGKWDEAFATLSQIMPEAQARHNLAGLLDHAGQTDMAKEQLRLALKADPLYTPARDLLRKLEPVAALPVVAGELPPLMPAPRALPAADSERSVCFETQVLKAPAGFCERAGVKLTGNTVLGDSDLRRLLEAAQKDRDASVHQLPKVTALDGQEATVKNCETQRFVTGGDVVRVKGQAVFVPKNTPVEVGDTLTVCGRVSAGEQTVTVRASFARAAVAGDVELIPVVTQVTPVFEGGSQGKPIPFTQYLQAPDVRTERVEKNVIISAGATIVLGSWKEAGSRPAQGRGLLKKPAAPAEYEVVTFVTARVVRDEPAGAAPAPRAPQADANLVYKYKLRNVAAADAARAVTAHLAGKRLAARVTEEAECNNVIVSADAAVQKQIGDLLAALDTAPPQVMVQATVMQVPRGFAAEAGLEGGAGAWTLSPREAKMLTGLIRAAKERGELDVLSRPQIQVADNQTGFVQVGQNFPVPTGGPVKAAGGAVDAKIEYVPTGFSMRLTPRVSPDGKSIQLRAEPQVTTVSIVDLKHRKPGEESVTLTPVPAFNTQSVNATSEVRDGETLVVAMGGAKYDTLIVLTPHIVRGETDGARVLADDAAKMKGLLPK